MTGVVNTVQIYSKRIFGNSLEETLTAVKSIAAKKIVKDPNYLWKSRPLSEKQNHEGADSIPESEWDAYFKVSL